MLKTYRKNDMVLMVYQDNEERAVKIHAVNDNAAALIGYSAKELANAPLRRFLPEHVAQMVDEYLDYEADGNDLASVLERVRRFKLRTRGGDELPFKLRVVRCDPVDHHLAYQLILIDETDLKKAEAVRALLLENFKGHETLDPMTTLPDRAAMLRNVELVTHYCHGEDGINVAFALMEIDGYDDLLVTHGRETCDKLLLHLRNICRQRLRGDDTIGYLGDWKLGFLLLDTSADSARLVLNRLRWVIGTMPLALGSGATLPFTVSIGFASINTLPAELEQDAITHCEQLLAAYRNHRTNLVVEIAA